MVAIVYGFKGIGRNAANPIYEIAEVYAQINAYIGGVAGVLYTIPFGVSGLFWGKFTNRISRKLSIGIIMGALGWMANTEIY